MTLFLIRKWHVVFVVTTLLLSACSSTNLQMLSSAASQKPAGYKNTASRYSIDGKTFYDVMDSSDGYLEIGVASWYGRKFHGRLTANGETYNMYALSAAHKTLPLPTWVRVTNLDNGQKVILRVNDRGPFHDNRLIDLSWKAAVQLGFASQGTAPVVVEALTGEPSNGAVTQAALHSEGTYFLQLGAFSRAKGAEYLKDKITLLIGRYGMLDIGVRILQSEDAQNVLHKVWIGPFRDEHEGEKLALWVKEMELGYPIRVDVN